MSDTDANMIDENAAEYALGVLTAEERAAAERRMARDPAFADQVQAWDNRLAPMIEAIPSVQPSRIVWMRIAAQLGILKTPVRPDAGLWDNINLWRAGTAAFAAAAAAAVAVLVMNPGAKPVAPSLAPTPVIQPISVGMLKGESDRISFVVTLDRQKDQLIIAPVAGSAASGKSYEMWMLPDGSDPVSMGVMDGSTVVVIDAARLLGVSRQNPPALAVSVEPEGGSPTGLPTGPVIASGALQPV